MLRFFRQAGRMQVLPDLGLVAPTALCTRWAPGLVFRRISTPTTRAVVDGVDKTPFR